MNTGRPKSVVSNGARITFGATDIGLWGGVEIYPLSHPIFMYSVRRGFIVEIGLKPLNA